MKIVINHLTRMRAGYICAAGVEPESLRHVRPVLEDGALPFDLLARYGGPLEMAAVVEMRSARPLPVPPHVEDHVIVPDATHAGGALSPDEFWDLLARLARTRLRDIFGQELHRVGLSSCGTDVGLGLVSLGCFRPKRTPRLGCVAQACSGKTRIRMRIADDEFEVDVGVTDVRLHEADHVTVNRKLVDEIARRIEGSAEVILGVGLTRPFTSTTAHGEEEAHWLQVTNIHLKEEPVWRLG
jgi:hypothetical protein